MFSVYAALGPGNGNMNKIVTILINFIINLGGKTSA